MATKIVRDFKFPNSSDNYRVNAEYLDGIDSSGFAKHEEGTHIIYNCDGTIDTTNKISSWTGTSDCISTLYDGLRISYKIPVAGNTTTTLNINGLGAKTIYRFGTTKLTTHFAVNQIITLIYCADLNDGCWVTNDYDSNTNYYHTPSATSGIKIATGTGVNDLFVPTGTTSTTVALGNHTHSGYVPTTRTVNGKALSSNITLTASDMSAYTKTEIDNLELITVADIDAICGTTIQDASNSANEVTF